MIKSDLHVHTNFCDGKNTPEEMVVSAIQKGVERLGLVVHAYTFFDNTYCVPKEKIKPFIDEMNRLKERYKGKIDLLCGVEMDYFSDMDTSGFDYVIGSLHYFYTGGKYYSVDHAEKYFIENVLQAFGGDYYSACENYFENLSGYATRHNPDIIGHFDLVRKFNKGNKFFDENNPRYIKARNDALDKLIALNKPFEINVGGIARGYQDFPYPCKEVIEYIKQKGGSFTLTSDSHNVNTIGFQFDKWNKYFQEKGVGL